MEITRRDALMGALLPFMPIAALAAAQQNQPAPQPFTQDLPNIMLDGWQVTATEITAPPGNVSRPHRHAGFVLVYVIEGELLVKISGRPETTYRAGQMFYEEPGATHEVNRNTSTTRPARFLAMIFAKKGETLTVPV